MKIVITGAAGFLGALLAERLLRSDADPLGAVDELCLIDLVEPPESVTAHERVRVRTGDIIDVADEVTDADFVFHLAGAVSSAAERDLDLGLRANIDGTRALLNQARAGGHRPTFVFASSLAVFGTEDGGAFVQDVTDETMPVPQSSYGTQKLICEHLVADYARRRHIHGRAVRLMTVAVRPGRPNAAASSFVSSIIREPLNGERAVCPVPPETPLAILSPARTIDALIRAASVDDSVWGSRRAVNLPALTTTPVEMARALDELTGSQLSNLIDWHRDAAIEGIVGTWPAHFHAERASGLRMQPDASIQELILQFINESALSGA